MKNAYFICHNVQVLNTRAASHHQSSVFFFVGFDVLPWLLLGWSGEEREGKEKEKTKDLKI